MREPGIVSCTGACHLIPGEKGALRRPLGSSGRGPESPGKAPGVSGELILNVLCKNDIWERAGGAGAPGRLPGDSGRGPETILSYFLSSRRLRERSGAAGKGSGASGELKSDFFCISDIWEPVFSEREAPEGSRETPGEVLRLF